MKYNMKYIDIVFLLLFILISSPALAAEGCPSCAHGHDHEHFEPVAAKGFDAPGTTGVFLFTVPAGKGRVEGAVRFPPGISRPPLALLLPDFGPYDREGGTALGAGDPRPLALAAMLIDHGIAVAAYDKRGTGFSTGERDLPHARHVHDAVALFRYLTTLDDRLRTESVLLVALGAGSVAAGTIAAHMPGVAGVVHLFPMLPDLPRALVRRRGDRDPAALAVAAVAAMPPSRVVPLRVASPDPLAVYAGSNPAETRELVETDFVAAIRAARAPVVAILDAAHDGVAGDHVTARVVDPRDGAATAAAVLDAVRALLHLK